MPKRSRPKIETPLQACNFLIDARLMGKVRAIAVSNDDSIGLTLNKVIAKGLEAK